MCCEIVRSNKIVTCSAIDSGTQDLGTQSDQLRDQLLLQFASVRILPQMCPRLFVSNVIRSGLAIRRCRSTRSCYEQGRATKKPPNRCWEVKWRGQDSNLRPRGYEPRELPGCSIPRCFNADVNQQDGVIYQQAPSVKGLS